MDASTNPESITRSPQYASNSENSKETEDAPKLLPRETGHDIGMGSPVPLSAEAVGIITRLRNMKVRMFQPCDVCELGLTLSG